MIDVLFLKAVFALALFSTLFSSPVSAFNGTCNTKLTREFLPSTSKCGDGSVAVYYVDVPPTFNNKWIIWLGDGEICGSNALCDKYCQPTSIKADDAYDEYCSTMLPSFSQDPAAQVVHDRYENRIDDVQGVEMAKCVIGRLGQCSHDLFGLQNYTNITASTLFCRDDPHFGDYGKAYLPSCTMDWFLGNGTSNPSEKKWTGSRHVDDMIAALNTTHQLFNASRVIIGGTGGGGIGAIHSFKRLRYGTILFAVPSVLLVVDSAWIVPSSRFANLTAIDMGPGATDTLIEDYLSVESGAWLLKALIDPDCLSFWTSKKENCLLPYEAIRRSLGGEKVFVLQSQYDINFMAQLDLLNLTLTKAYVDNASYAQGAVNFIEGYARNVRRTIEGTAYYRGASDGHFYFSAACAQHGYILPSEVTYVDGVLVDLGRGGKLAYTRDASSYMSVSVGGVVLRDALVQWVESEGTAKPNSGDPQVELELAVRNGVRSDRCQTFLCNPSCSTSIIPFTIDTIWGPCTQRIIVAYCAVVLCIFWVMFILASFAVVRYRMMTGRYWRDIIHKERAEKQNGDPNEIEAGFRAAAEDEIVRDAFATNRQVHLMVRNLSYWAAPKSRNAKPYQIIRNVTATFPAGEVHAMMGPSGSGKSTMLDLVALTRENGFMIGTHYVNGVESHTRHAKFLREWLRHNISYVRQQDELFPLLTVREHLTHAAWLMLPEFMASEAKLRRVWQVIKLLDLERAADTICGDGGVLVEGGISGGQRRRVSVATQLLRLPAALILDEPTSGLDSTSALLLVKSLHTLAHRGKTNVIMTIHQPRREIYRYLDSIKILVAGKMLFAGAPKEAFDHFEVSKKLNIGDEILDQLAKASPTQVQGFQKKYENGPLGKRTRADVIQEVVLDFDFYVAWELQQVLVVNALAEGRWSWTESSSAPTMMWVLLSRTIKRGGFDILKTVLMSIVGGLLVGIVFLSATDTYTRHTALCYLCVATMTFLQGTFIGDRYWAEKFMYDFESDAGTARPWISFLWSMYARLFVSTTLEALGFAIPVFFVGKLNSDGNRTNMFLLIMVMVALATSTQYLLVEIYFMRPDDKRTGALVNIALLSLSALFNGFIIQLKDLPVYLAWLPPLMLAYWGFVGLLINDLQGFAITCDASELECAARTGDNVLKGLQYDNRDIYICLFALLCFVVAAIVLGVLVFFFKYVARFGGGLRRKTTKETREADAKWKEEAKNEQNGTSGESTMNKVLQDGKETKKLIKQNSAGGLKRAGSAEGLMRNDSLGKNSSIGEPNSTQDDGDFSVNPLLRGPSGGAFEMDEDGEDLNDNGNACSKISEEGFLTQLIISRLMLVNYFLLDFLVTSVICNGIDQSALKGQTFDDLLSGSNTTDIFGNIGASSGGKQNELFIFVDGIFMAGYLLQFGIQFFLLIPRGADGRLRFCTRIALLDVFGAGFSALDVIFFFILLGAGATISLQIWLMVAIRLTRIGRVASFWFKISSFHKLRALAYLRFKELMMGDYDPSAYENVGNEPEDLVDKKPPVPQRGTKPKIPTHLLPLLTNAPAGLNQSAQQLAGNFASETAADRVSKRKSAGVGGMMRNMIKSMRGGAEPVSNAADQPIFGAGGRLTDGGRKSIGGPPPIPNRLMPNNARLSFSAQGGLALPPGLPNRPVINLPSAMAGIAPPPGFNRKSISVKNHTSSAGGIAPVVPARPNVGFFGAVAPSSVGAGGPPPVPARMQQNLAGFGIGAGAKSLIKKSKAPPREIMDDEI